MVATDAMFETITGQGSERLGHANIGIALDAYSHVLLGLQKAAAERFDKMLEPRVNAEDVSKMLAKDPGPDSGGR